MAPEPFEVKYVRILNAQEVFEGDIYHFHLQLPKVTLKELRFLDAWQLGGWQLHVSIEDHIYAVRQTDWRVNPINRIATELIFLNGIPGNRHSLELHLKGETASCAQERLEYPLDRTMIFK